MSNGGLSIKHRVMDESKVDDGKGCTKPAHQFFQIDHPATCWTSENLGIDPW